MIEIDISSTFKLLEKEFSKLSRSQIQQVTKRAVNKTLTRTRSFASKQIRTKLNLKQKTLFGKHIDRFKAQGMNSEGSLTFKSRPLSLVNFKTGRGQGVPSQVGKSMSQRSKVNIKYRKGTTTKVKGGFIAKGKGGNVHVFKRASKNNKSYIKVQAGPSVAEFMRENNIINPVKTAATSFLIKEVSNSMRLEFSRISMRSRAWR